MYNTKSRISAVIGSVLATGLNASPIVFAGDSEADSKTGNPFVMQSLNERYVVAYADRVGTFIVLVLGIVLGTARDITRPAARGARRSVAASAHPPATGRRSESVTFTTSESSSSSPTVAV